MHFNNEINNISNIIIDFGSELTLEAKWITTKVEIRVATTIPNAATIEILGVVSISNSQWSPRVK